MSSLNEEVMWEKIPTEKRRCLFDSQSAPGDEDFFLTVEET